MCATPRTRSIPNRQPWTSMAKPIRALQIIDSAVIVGNLSEMQAEICRARRHHRMVAAVARIYWYLPSAGCGLRDRCPTHRGILGRKTDTGEGCWALSGEGFHRRPVLPVHQRYHCERTTLPRPQVRSSDHHGPLPAFEGARRSHFLQGQRVFEGEQLCSEASSGSCHQTAFGTSNLQHQTDQFVWKKSFNLVGKALNLVWKRKKMVCTIAVQTFFCIFASNISCIN